MTSFQNTIPLHVREVFGWGSLETGLLFFCLQIPNILFGPVCGWIRDRVGVRYPMAAGWALVAPLLWLLATPGDGRFPWAKAETHGPAITISSLVGIGTVGSLLQGAGPTVLTGLSGPSLPPSFISLMNIWLADPLTSSSCHR